MMSWKKNKYAELNINCTKLVQIIRKEELSSNASQHFPALTKHNQAMLTTGQQELADAVKNKWKLQKIMGPQLKQVMLKF